MMKWFRFRFSLRVFVVGIALFAVAMGFWARGALRQRQTVRALGGIGVSVVYDFEREQDSERLFAQTWLANRFGKDWVSVPVEAKASAQAIYPEDLELLASCRWLRVVDLGNTTTDDDGLAHLGRLPRLESLTLSRTLVTRLSGLERCRSLKHLQLDSSLVRDEEIQRFKRTLSECEVIFRWPVKPSSVESKRFNNLRADRTPTTEEKLKREVFVAVLDTTDGWEQHLLFRRIEDLEPLPPAGSQEYRDLQEFMRNCRIEDTWRDAIKEIGMLGLAKDISILERFARDRSVERSVRTAAVRALSMIADRRIIPILIDLLEDQDRGVVNAAWASLTGATGESMGHVPWAFPTEDNAERRQLIADWRQFWKENGDVIRPRRYASFQGVY